jgi:hypothetical protein
MGENSILCNGEDNNEATPFKVPAERFKEEPIVDVNLLITLRLPLEANMLSS